MERKSKRAETAMACAKRVRVHQDTPRFGGIITGVSQPVNAPRTVRKVVLRVPRVHGLRGQLADRARHLVPPLDRQPREMRPAPASLFLQHGQVGLSIVMRLLLTPLEKPRRGIRRQCVGRRQANTKGFMSALLERPSPPVRSRQLARQVEPIEHDAVDVHRGGGKGAAWLFELVCITIALHEAVNPRLVLDLGCAAALDEGR
mmetsp:Transcript_41644/g.83531  ORF Transcript_41644/g.83531 Transcript_41644/m.83531 type:complete len:203 (+) Transcript_41644:168-776(+)